MRTRVWSSIAVVGAALLPVLCGGPVFALFLLALCAAGFREYLALASQYQGDGGRTAQVGYLGIVALGVAAYWQVETAALFAAISVCVLLPLLLAVPFTGFPGAFAGWALTSSGTLYLGLPVYAAVTMRGMPGQLEASWLSDLASAFSFGWESAPRGLAWVLGIVLATWTGDSSAYLAGRSFGRRQLAPGISPNKTMEGAIAGLLAAVATSIVWFAVSGLGNVLVATGIGVVVAVSGQLGDLAESMLKRQAAVKDSGDVIPGHGGILDRIDALLFAFPASFLTATLVERLAR